MYSGTADPLVPYQDALNYYGRVIGVQQRSQDKISNVCGVTMPLSI